MGASTSTRCACRCWGRKRDLTEHDNSAEHVNFDGESTPLHPRVLNGHATLGNSTPSIREQHMFLEAAKMSDWATVRRLLQANVGLVNCQPSGRWSALHQAAQKGHAPSVRLLLENGAATSARTRDGLTPLEVASPDVFEILLEATLAESAANAPKNDASSGRASDDVIQRLPLRTFARYSSSPLQLDRAEDNATPPECEQQCHICLEDFVDGDLVRDLNCSHSFHAHCVDVWLMEKSASCPLCRADVAATDPTS